MTTQNASATSTKAPVKTYNLLGVVSDVSLKTDKNEKAYATFSLTKASDGKTIKCTVFAEHVEKIGEVVKSAAGGNVKLFGRYDRRSFQGQDGKAKTSMRFRALWAGLPKAKEAAEESDSSQDVGF